MPSKMQLDDSLKFLDICLQNSNLKTEPVRNDQQIDFNAVANAAGIKPPAARMRYTRLRRQLEQGTLTGTRRSVIPNTSPGLGNTAETGIAKQKRKRTLSGMNHGPQRGPKTRVADANPDVYARMADVAPRTEVVAKVVVKKEDSDAYNYNNNMNDTRNIRADSNTSSDEIPLAQLQKTRLAATNKKPVNLKIDRSNSHLAFGSEPSSDVEGDVNTATKREIENCALREHAPSRDLGPPFSFQSEAPHPNVYTAWLQEDMRSPIIQRQNLMRQAQNREGSFAQECENSLLAWATSNYQIPALPTPEVSPMGGEPWMQMPVLSQGGPYMGGMRLGHLPSYQAYPGVGYGTGMGVQGLGYQQYMNHQGDNQGRNSGVKIPDHEMSRFEF